MKTISVIFGTRPEAIKLSPIILALRGASDIRCRVCVTGQHRQMLDQVLGVFGITPDEDLDLMLPDQSLAGLTARAMRALDGYLGREQPNLVLVQGDTTTVFCAALAAFYHKIPVGHVEAGLRTWNLQSPWPEEANRVLTSRLVRLHFAPTASSKSNLIREGVAEEHITVTGNTVVDALFLALHKTHRRPPHIPGLPDCLQPGDHSGNGKPRVVLITGHRRENFGEGFENICRAIRALAREFTDVHFVYPVHLNPNVRKTVTRLLGGDACRPSEVRNLHLLEPLPYLPFVALLERASVVLTDSGGVQEEAPSLGKPVLVMRDTTERPEAVEAGTVHLVGTQHKQIVGGVSRLLTDTAAYAKMARAHNPYGDGRAAARILRICREFLKPGPSREARGVRQKLKGPG